MLLADDSLEWIFKKVDLDTKAEQLDAGKMMAKAFDGCRVYPQVVTNKTTGAGRPMTFDEQAMFCVTNFMIDSAVTNSLGEISEYRGKRIETPRTCNPILERNWTTKKIEQYKKDYKLNKTGITLKRDGKIIKEAVAIEL